MALPLLPKEAIMMKFILHKRSIPDNENENAHEAARYGSRIIAIGNYLKWSHVYYFEHINAYT